MAPYLGYDAETSFIPGTLNTSSSLTVQGGGITQTGGDVNFDSSTFYVDSVNNRVGIGTITPSAVLHVVNAAVESAVRIQGRSSDNLARIDFYKNDNTTLNGRLQTVEGSNNLRVRAEGALELYSGGNNQRAQIDSSGGFQFKGAGTAGVTQAVSFNGSAPVNSLVITSGGLVGLGTSSLAAGLTVATYGSQPETSANTYSYPVGRHHVNLGTVPNATNIWAGFVGTYANSSGSCNLLLQPGYNDLGNQAGAYIGGELTGTASTAITFGHLFGAATLTGNATKIERMRIRADGTVEIKGAGSAGVSPAVSVNPSAPANSAVMDSSGRLGLGTPAPSYLFHALTSDATSAAFKNSGAANTQIIIGNTAGDTAIRTTSAGDTLIYSDTGKPLGLGTNNGSTRLHITSAGLVGIGTTGPQAELNVAKVGGASTVYIESDAGNNATTSILRFGGASGRSASIQGFRGASSNIQSLDFYTYNSADAFGMRLTSTGLGIGTNNPATTLEVNGTSYVTDLLIRNNVGTPSLGTAPWLYSPASGALAIATNANERMRIDSSGNVGIGVVPSAQFSTVKALQVGALGATIIAGNTSAGGTSAFGQNFYTDPTTAAYKYAASSYAATTYNQYNGEHRWLNAPSGTAGNTITFTQAMMLDASGRLGIGTTPDSYARLHVSNGGAEGFEFQPGTVTANVNTIFSYKRSTSAYISLDFLALNHVFRNSGGEAARIDSSGRLLVGAIFSQAGAGEFDRLQVTGAINVVSSTNVYSRLLPTASGLEIIANAYPANVGSTQSIIFKSGSSGGGGPSEIARFTSDGRLGIGTIGPAKLLHVQSGSVSGAARGGSFTKTLFESSDAAASYWELQAASTATNDILFSKSSTGSYGVVGYDHVNDALRFHANSAECARINSSGYSKFTNANTYVEGGGFAYHEFYRSGSGLGLVLTAANASYASIVNYIQCSRAASSAYSLLSAYSANGVDREFDLKGDGNGYCDGAWTGGGADYAEYFEWSDGNSDEQDRRGVAVVLDNDKIRPAIDGEDPIGVISGNPSVVGDAAWNKWSGKYLRDDFGTYIQEDYEVEDEDGNTVVQQRRKLNPAYDSEADYIPREQRHEWDCVGLMGKLRIRKGQPTGSRWIKMRDISDSVEEWLVR